MGVIIGGAAFVANIICSIIFHGDNGANIFTAISGWISGIATVIVGIIAYRQSMRHKLESEEKERYVDLVVENVAVVKHSLPDNVLGRRCVPKDSNLFGHYRFLITIFSFNENPIFDVNIEKTIKEGNLLVPYDLIQPIQKDIHKRSFLCKNEFMQLVAEIPKNDNLSGQYQMILCFKNHYGDIFQKDLYVHLRKDFSGNVAKVSQGKVMLIKKEKNNGQA